MSTSKINGQPRRGMILRALGCFMRFAGNRDGATAIEFTVLALPFAALTFAILESCISFAAQEVLANATDDIARQIRTGQLKKADITETSLRQVICGHLEIIVASGCSTSPELVVELQNSGTFAEAAGKAKLTMKNNDLFSSGVNPGGALTINTLKVAYKWPVITNFLRKEMSNLKDGKTLLIAKARSRDVEFHVKCDAVDLHAPNGSIQARGNVKVSAGQLDAAGQSLTIQLNDDQLLLEGQARVTQRGDGQDLELRAERLTLRLLMAQAEVKEK